ncbi:MAG TPA: amino acid adenylation domain-containing protein [Pyrinomonadaceae bacterium]|nr:amino acid adenylation domain-containing protein [Pyrinomonadaceae bacterium]
MTTLAFDIAGLELYLPLSVGAKLVLADRETATDGHRLLALLRASSATVMQATPATWRLLLDALTAERPPTAEVVSTTEQPLQLKVLCGGEALPGSLAGELSQTIEGAVYNLYGPTETTIWSALHTVNEADAERATVALGHPIANTQLYLLDQALRPVPVGVRGELYIGGDGVARGYWNRGELTAERFVPDPFSRRGGDRLYRTGDEGRYLATGEIEYLGRSDQQVKLRGYRIELGEIEAALREHESVSNAAVAVCGERLVAYVVPAGDLRDLDSQTSADQQIPAVRQLSSSLSRSATPGTAPVSELRTHLQQRLPEYMVPSVYLTLPALPQTPNGKLDRKALPEPDPGAAINATVYEAPRTPVEEVLAAIVAEVLQVPKVGRQDDFFTLGGHSLLAMQVISRIRKAFQVELPVRVLFETPTLARFASHLEQAQVSGKAKADGPPLRMLPRGSVTRDGVLPLSFAQQRLWFLDQLEPGSPLYNIPAAVRLTGQLNTTALEQTLNEVLRRHESLRTRFHEVNGRAAQVIEPELKLSLTIEDLQHLSPGQRDEELQHITRTEAQKPFDLSRAPLLRVRLFRLDDEEHVILLTIHHIIGDEWSMGVLVREMATLYGACSQQQTSPLNDLPIQYADYAAWQREWLQGELLANELAYWQRQLHQLPVLHLPTDRPRPPVQTYHGARYLFPIAPELSTAVNNLAQQQRATKFMMLLAAFQTLLHRYSTQDDIAIGTPIAGRDRLETESLIGLFVNTLVLRGDLSGDPDFNELLCRVRDTAFAAYAHDDVPFEKLVEQLQPERDLSRTPLFQAAFVLQNDPVQSLEVSGLKLDPFPVDTGTAKFDLLLAIVEEPNGLRGSVEYNTDLFDPATIERMARHFQNLLASIVADPTQRLSQLQLLSAEEKTELLAQGLQVRFDSTESLSRLFELQAEKTPAAVALAFENETVTYADLNRRSNQLAHYLRDLGIGPEAKVGICMERGVEMIVGLLAILKAGGAYVPLDPAYPAQRLSFMVQDAQINVLLGQHNLRDAIPDYTGRWLDLEEQRELISIYPHDNLDAQTTAGNLAYVIYTSGSTGNPKGVLVTHANVTRLFAATNDEFKFDENDVWTFFHSFAFDFSVWEIWGALLYGGRLVIVPYLASRSPQDFYQLLRAERVTVLNQTPSSFLQLIKFEKDHGPADDLSLRLVIFGGEALDLQSLRPWIAHHGDRKPLLVNMYGITETTVHVTCRTLSTADIDQDPGSLIGNSIPDLQLYLLDQQLQPVPWRVTAELCVGGAGVARGYLNSPELTAQKFIPDPHSKIPGSRLYKSGDSARRLPDGEIEYLGRLDQQVKIKGFRIEVGEIETALSTHPAVRECVVMVREDVPGDKQLAAYVVAQPAQSPNVTELRSWLKQKLPEYMIPAAFVLLQEFPLTQNGKLDRRALPAPDNIRPELAAAYVSPESEVEKSLARIWSEVLHLDRVGVHDSFFALGGDSIRSIEVRSRAEQLGLRFSLQQLFQYQTIHELSQQLNGTRIKPAVHEQTRPWTMLTDTDRQRLPEEIEDAYPLALLQAGMLFHSEYAAGVATYHDVFSFRLRVAFNEDALRSAVERLMLRHPVLRTSFDVSSFSEPLQLVHRSAPAPLTVEDLTHLSALEQDEVISAWLAAEGKARFDWTRPPLFRIQVHRRSDQGFQFSLGFHHAILDGWSVASLLTELFQSYLANLGQAVRPSESLPETTYKNFIALEQQAIRSQQAQDYWLQKLEGAVSNRLPRWSSRKGAVPESRVLTLSISSNVFTGLKQVAQDVSAPLKSVLLAAHLRVLSLLSGQTEVITGLVSNGRPEQSGAERTLGLFLNTLPVRASLRGGAWKDLIRQTLEIEKEMLPFRWYPLASMQQHRGAEALFETGFSFNHFHVYERLRDLEGVEVLEEKIFEQTNFTLGAIFNLDSTSSQLHLQLNYNAAELTAEQIDAIGDYYLATLNQIATAPAERYEASSLLPESELRRLLSEWNQTKAEFPDNQCVHQWFEAQAARTPEAVALVCEDEQISFRRLNERANHVGHRLQQLGVGPESLVGICLERSVELIVGLLGILKAGGAYVPLDPGYPRERLSFMLEDAGAQVLVTNDNLRPLLADYNGQIVCPDTEREPADAETTKNCVSNVTPANLAYVIYTSGSTGKPKGVSVTHHGVCNTLRWRQTAFSLSEQDRMLQTISIAFDPSVWQIFGSLVTGSCLVLASPGGDKDVSYLVKTIREQKITIADFVPSLLQPFLEQEPQDACQQLRHVFCGGEALPVELIEQFYKSIPAQLHNMYGPTEGTIDTTSWPCEPLRDGQSVSIGRPVANKRVYLLDQHLQPVPTGVPGHLHVGGVGLTRGYLNQPQLSAEKLIPDLFATEPGAQLYRTGDLARYLPDGRIEFLGRLDQQVKVRGFRIELEEIEAALASHEAVQSAVVLALERTKGRKELVAYVIADKTRKPTVSELRAHLKQRLPDYMTPSYFVLLDEWPLTPNGKLDRLALPPPADIRSQGETVYLAPRNEVEKIVAQVWQDVLQLDQVGVHDNFFDLGGHSLLMLRIQGKVRTLFNRDMSIVEMFRYPTVSSLAEILGSAPPKQQSLDESKERATAARAATRRRRELRKTQPV